MKNKEPIAKRLSSLPKKSKTYKMDYKQNEVTVVSKVIILLILILILIINDRQKPLMM